MKKKILISLSYILVAMLATVATLAAIGYPGYASGTKLEQLESLILERFIGDADQTAMEDAAAAAMVKSLGDRWSYYIPASEYDAHEEQVNNAYVGIGITIEAKEQEGFLVKAVNESGPAGEAGVQVDDLVIEVEGQDVREMTATDVRNLVRGEEGTCVSLTVLRQGERVTLSVERRQVRTVVASGRMLTDKIGLVTIENFDSRCAEETIAAIDDLLGQGAEKLIFDVRNNPGGYAKELVKVLDYLLPEGELFRTVDYAGKENVDHSDADCLDIPMAVLVNGDSYSAAEFFAAALSEYGVADVVGRRPAARGISRIPYVSATVPRWASPWASILPPRASVWQAWESRRMWSYRWTRKPPTPSITTSWSRRTIPRFRRRWSCWKRNKSDGRHFAARLFYEKHLPETCSQAIYFI